MYLRKAKNMNKEKGCEMHYQPSGIPCNRKFYGYNWAYSNFHGDEVRYKMCKKHWAESEKGKYKYD